MGDDFKGELMVLLLGVLPVVAQCGILAWLMLTDRDKGE